MNRIPLFALLATSAISVFSSQALAVSADITSVTGVWSDIVPPGTTGLTGAGTNEIRWGTPAGTPDKSGYRFDGNAPQTGLLADAIFTLGTFTHFNAPIAAGTSISGARLTVDIVADFFNGMTTVTRNVTSVFDFAHFETPNSASPCADGGTVGVGVNVNGCADQVTPILNLGLSDTFEVDGLTYIFNTTGFDIGASFWTKEQAANTAHFTGTFTTKIPPSAVPLPAALPLLLAGLGAKRRQAA
jgi:hypothetical protein